MTLERTAGVLAGVAVEGKDMKDFFILKTGPYRCCLWRTGVGSLNAEVHEFFRMRTLYILG